MSFLDHRPQASQQTPDLHESQILPKQRPSQPTSQPHTAQAVQLAAKPNTNFSSSSKVREPGSSFSHRRMLRDMVGRRPSSYRQSLELPERLKITGPDAEQEEDVRPITNNGQGMPMNINQSIFGLIAAAGSNVDFHNRFEGHSSDEEDEGGEKRNQKSSLSGNTTTESSTARQERDASARPLELRPSGDCTKSHSRKFSDSKLARSVPILGKLARHRSTKKAAKAADQAAPVHVASTPSTAAKRVDSETPAVLNDATPSSASSSPSISDTDTGERLAPVMSRMLEAKAKEMARSSTDIRRRSGEKARASASITDQDANEVLAERLQDIFGFDEPEKVVSEYPCWLLQSVLLQGFLYVTSKHVCFYSYLPKKANEVSKSGYLSKSGKHTSKHTRFWFRLKGEVLSYYHDSANKYFPHGQIDLRYGISASLSDKSKDGTGFTVETDQRIYHLKADSAISAKEWVKCLQKVIFRSHNEGNAVKISIPIHHILDVEETQMLEHTDTCKLRVLETEDSYAIDEYFFSFFSYGQEAIRVLKILVEDSADRKSPRVLGSENDTGGLHADLSQSHSLHSGQPGPINTKLTDTVRSTLSPTSPSGHPGHAPRASGEFSRSSFDGFRPFVRKSSDTHTPRRSVSQDSRVKKKAAAVTTRSPLTHQDSSDSYAQSTDEPSQTSGSAWVGASSEMSPSASQILQGSEVFHSPTFGRSTSATRRHQQQTEQLSPTHPPGMHAPQHAATTGQLTNTGDAHRSDYFGPGTPTLQNIAKMGAFPLQRAGAFADYLGRHTKRAGSLLASESMGYVEKVSGMWKGGQKHYGEHAGFPADDDLNDLEGADEKDKITLANARFTAHFALPATECLKATYFGFFLRVLPLYGKIYLSDNYFCYRSLLPGTRTKVIIPLWDIETVDKEKGFRFGYHGLVLVMRGHEELFFDFGQIILRDDLAISLLYALEACRHRQASEEGDKADIDKEQYAVAEHDALEKATRNVYVHEYPHMAASVTSEGPTIVFDDPKASFLDFKPDKSLRITCLTIGSRGDVQPYIALCKGLLADGHKPRIATHKEFKGWIEQHGIEFAEVAGDPAELMRLCIENGTFTVSFMREANATMRTWITGLLQTAWTACQGSDVLVESPSAMAGIHIAEKLGIPYFRAFGMPWTRTRSYPHAFIVPEHKMGGAYNYVTYVMFDNVFWKATAAQINKWRNKTLGLPNTSLEKLQPNKVPFLYNFSPHVVPPPMDFSDWIKVTGYWFLDEGTKDWTPPEDLTNFIAQARKDGKKLVYVGFGSIILDNPEKFTREIVNAVLKADVRCILSKGWSGRGDKKHGHEKHHALLHSATAANSRPSLDSTRQPQPKHASTAPSILAPNVEVVPLPPEVFVIKSAPHDWLFKQIDAAAHHGGSGTTGASLRAGLPTIIRPFFGDQFFFGSRVEDLGVGINMRKWGANTFARALWEATNSERMIAKARELGKQINKEHGVTTAIQAIYRDMDYAKSLMLRKQQKMAAATATTTSAAADTSDSPDLQDLDDGEEESWTFVGAPGAHGAGKGGPADSSSALTTPGEVPAEAKKLGLGTGIRVLPGDVLTKSPGPE